MVGLYPTALGFPQLVYPPHPGNEADPFDIRIWEEEFKSIADKKRNRKLLSEQAFAIVIGQCSPSVLERIESNSSYPDIVTRLDVIELLVLIRNSLYNGSTARSHEMASTEAFERLMFF